jgi:hypothetical protein
MTEKGDYGRGMERPKNERHVLKENNRTSRDDRNLEIKF